MDQFIWIIFVFAFIGGWYVWYFRKIKKAGGYGAILERINQAKWGLLPGEPAPQMEWTGEVYIGELIAGSGPSTGEQVMGFLTNTTYRGRLLAIAVTPSSRLVISAEPTEDQKTTFDARMGDQGFRPLFAFAREARPRLVDARVAFAGHPKLEKELGAGPRRFNKLGREVRLQLVVMQTPEGHPLAFWCEPDGLPPISAWCG